MSSNVDHRRLTRTPRPANATTDSVELGTFRASANNKLDKALSQSELNLRVIVGHIGVIQGLEKWISSIDQRRRTLLGAPGSAPPPYSETPPSYGTSQSFCQVSSPAIITVEVIDGIDFETLTL